MGVFTQGGTRYSQNIGMVMPAFDPLTFSGGGGTAAFSNSNLTVTALSTATFGYITSWSNTAHNIGKYYVEFVFNDANPGHDDIAIAVSSERILPNNPGFDNPNTSIAFYEDGTVQTNVIIGNATPFTTGDVVSLAMYVNGNLYWQRVNGGNWNNNSSNNPATNTGGFSLTIPETPYIHFGALLYNVGDAVTVDLTPPFAYSPPSGFGPW